MRVTSDDGLVSLCFTDLNAYLEDGLARILEQEWQQQIMVGGKKWMKN